MPSTARAATGAIDAPITAASATAAHRLIDALPERSPGPGQVVAEGECQQDSQPEDAADHDRPGEPRTVLHVHEEQDHQRRLHAGDRQRDHRVEYAKVDERGLYGEVGPDH